MCDDDAGASTSDRRETEKERGEESHEGWVWRSFLGRSLVDEGSDELTGVEREKFRGGDWTKTAGMLARFWCEAGDAEPAG